MVEIEGPDRVGIFDRAVIRVSEWLPQQKTSCHSLAPQLLDVSLISMMRLSRDEMDSIS